MGETTNTSPAGPLRMVVREAEPQLRSLLAGPSMSDADLAAAHDLVRSLAEAARACRQAADAPQRELLGPMLWISTAQTALEFSLHATSSRPADRDVFAGMGCRAVGLLVDLLALWLADPDGIGPSGQDEFALRARWAPE